MKLNKKGLIRILVAACGLVLITVLVLCLAFCGNGNGNGNENENQGDSTSPTHLLNGKEVHVDIAYKLDTLEGVTVLSNAQPTCSEFGKGYFTCDCCNALQLILINTLPHNFQTKTVSAPTCTEAGTEVTACIDCGKSTSSEIPALGHDYFYDVSENENGTFTLNGKCACGDENVGIIAISKQLTKNSTCAEWGIVSYSTAEGAVIEVKTDKKQHTLNGEYVDLDEMYNVSTPGINEIVNLSASCTENGLGFFTCEVCESDFMVTIFKNHNYDISNPIVETNPTCTTPGVGRIRCTECGDYTEYAIPKANHIYNYKSYDSSTKIFNGNCESCNENLTFTVDVDNITVEKDPTCEAAGSVIYSNEDGTISATARIDKLPHKLGEIEIHDGVKYNKNIPGIVEIEGHEATCSSEGLGYFMCDICNKANAVTIQSHSYVDKTWYATEDGVRYKYTGKECSDCKETYVIEKEVSE